MQEHKRHKKHKAVWLVVLCFLCLLCSFLSAQTLKVDVNLVNVFATVKDEHGDFVTDLKREDFRVYEDDVLQDVSIFETKGDVHSSIAILMDSSGSMVDLLPLMKRGIRDFTRTLAKPDDFFVVSFGTNVRLIHKSSQRAKHLEETMAAMRAWGTSVMYDALLFSMEKVEAYDQERKALIVFTDGNDNGSNVGHSRVVEEAQRSGVLMYFVAIGSPVLVDAYTLNDLADTSGGRVLFVAKQDSIPNVLEQIRAELAKQYYLGYYAPRRSGYHHIRVEVPGRNLKLRAKTGYLGG